MGRPTKKPTRSVREEPSLSWTEHMFLKPADKRMIQNWSSHYGWSETVARRNFTVYRALEWQCAVLHDQIETTEGWFWMQLDRLASVLGKSRPTIRAAIAHLVELDLIEHDRRWLRQSESLCSWFRLKIPPSCVSRVRKDQTLMHLQGLRRPPAGTSKNSSRRVNNSYAPSSSNRREQFKREKAEQIAEIQDRCLRKALDPQAHIPEIAEIVQMLHEARKKAERQERRELRSAGNAEFLDVKEKQKAR